MTQHEAEALAAKLPPLLIAAERVAATVAQGVHGRRRVGVGDSFWQFRPYVAGDAPARIDWRQSAKSDRAFVRDTEWEAAQTVCLWRDASPSMQWRSSRTLPSKRERAELLLLTLVSLLARAGEQMRLLGVPGRVFTGRNALTATAQALPDGGEFSGYDQAPGHATAILLGDWLRPASDITSALSSLAERGVRGHVLMVVDPAELTLPYDGRVRFRGLEGEGEHILSRVEGVRDAYRAAMDEQQAMLQAACRAVGFGFAVHRTDTPPEATLLPLWLALGARHGR